MGRPRLLSPYVGMWPDRTGPGRFDRLPAGDEIELVLARLWTQVFLQQRLGSSQRSVRRLALCIRHDCFFHPGPDYRSASGRWGRSFHHRDVTTLAARAVGFYHRTVGRNPERHLRALGHLRVGAFTAAACRALARPLFRMVGPVRGTAFWHRHAGGGHHSCHHGDSQSSLRLPARS